MSCPTCHGSPRIHRLTPDFAKALGLQPLWDEQVAARMGVWSWGRESRPADKQRLFLEYPSGDDRAGLGGGQGWVWSCGPGINVAASCCTLHALLPCLNGHL